MRPYRALVASAALYLTGLILHTADHVRRGLAVLTTHVEVAGYLSTIAGLIVIALIVARHPRAPLLAAVFGPLTAVGVAAVHLLPHWSAFSDAFPHSIGNGVTAFSWAVVLLEMAGALAMGFFGLLCFKEQRDGLVA